METVTNAHLPLIQKGDAWRLQAVANARKYKTVLELRDKQGLSWREIAERMNYSESYVRPHIYAGKHDFGNGRKIQALSAFPENKGGTHQSRCRRNTSYQG